jgi:hypothetical protein
MFGLPADTDLSFLHGRQLTQVCVGQYQVLMHFDEEVSISVDSEIDISHEATAMADQSTSSANPGDLLPALGALVKNASAPGDGSLVISFDNGVVVKVLDSSLRYESYQIWNGSEIIIV